MCVARMIERSQPPLVSFQANGAEHLPTESECMEISIHGLADDIVLAATAAAGSGAETSETDASRGTVYST
jgi:hypothetical protein